MGCAVIIIGDTRSGRWSRALIQRDPLDDEALVERIHRKEGEANGELP